MDRLTEKREMWEKQLHCCAAELLRRNPFDPFDKSRALSDESKSSDSESDSDSDSDDDFIEPVGMCKHSDPPPRRFLLLPVRVCHR